MADRTEELTRKFINMPENAGRKNTSVLKVVTKRTSPGRSKRTL